MSNEEIVKHIQNGIDVTVNQECLWNKNQRFIKCIIKKYIGDCCKEDLEDFMQQGFIGLVKAAGKYKADCGTKFLTYAEYHIKTSLFRYNGCNNSSIHVPEYLKTRMRRLAEFKKSYAEEFHREPEPDEIQKGLNISRKSLIHLEKTIQNMRTKSLDEYVSDDGKMELIDLLASDECIEDFAGNSEYQKQLHKELEEAFTILDHTTAGMIRSAYYQGNTYEQTGKIFKCSRQAVHDRINKGFYKIIHSRYCGVLESFMWEGYHVNPYRLADYVDIDAIDNMSSEFLL